MPRNAGGRVETLHPDPERKGTRISRATYDAVCNAILDALPDGETGLRFADLSEAVESRVPQGLFENASVGWYTTTVKLDLEAKGLISRASGSRPQRLVRRPVK